MSSHQRQVAALFDQVAADYDQHVPFFAAFADLMVPWVGIHRGDLVADLGVGRGAVADRCEALGARVVRVDMAMNMLGRNRGVRCLMDGQLLGFKPECFDLVVSAFAIHLFADPVAAVGEAVRVLRRGGVLAIAVGGPTASTRLDFYGPILAKYERRASRPPTLPPRADFDHPAAVFAEAGLRDVASRAVEVHVPVRDAPTFLRGEQAHGRRRSFDQLADADRRALEAELTAHLEAMDRDGGIFLDRGATFVMGTKKA